MLTNKQKERIDELHSLKKKGELVESSLTKSRSKNCFNKYPHHFTQIANYEVGGVYDEVRSYCISKGYSVDRSKKLKEGRRKLVTNIWRTPDGEHFTKVDIEIRHIGTGSYIESYLIPNEILTKSKL
jgi:hypothetical protein